MVDSVRRDSRIASAAPQVAAHQGEVGRLDGHVGAGAHRQPEVGLSEGGRVVDAVADHRDDPALGLQPADDVDLVLRQHLGHDVGRVDADLAATVAAAAALSPVSSTGRRPRSRSCSDRARRASA